MVKLLYVEHEELMARKAAIQEQLEIIRSMPREADLENALDEINFLLGED